MEVRIKNTLLRLVQGDITGQETGAIVNAANSGLMGGGGVDGAIHRAGGPQILVECKEIRARHGKCPTGEAVITGGGNLKAPYVIHTVGPVWRGGNNNEDRLLANAYRNSLVLAEEKGLKSVSFPSISTGAYGFPVERAAGIALAAVKEHIEGGTGLEEVRFVLFSAGDLEKYREALEKM